MPSSYDAARMRRSNLAVLRYIARFRHDIRMRARIARDFAFIGTPMITTTRMPTRSAFREARGFRYGRERLRAFAALR